MRVVVVVGGNDSGGGGGGACVDRSVDRWEMTLAKIVISDVPYRLLSSPPS